MSRVLLVLFCALFGTLVGARCKPAPTTAPGGTIVLSVDSTRLVDRVQIKATDKDGNSTEFSFETKGRDLTKDAASGELVPGTAIKTGPVSFVGYGFVAGNNSAVVSGRIEAEFVAAARTNVRLSLSADRVDEDQDGFIKQEDCNDKNSKQNPFLNDLCSNDLDDDCDGSIDEHCVCTSGQTRSCYASLDQTSRGFGECRDGVQTCVSGAWSECAGSVVPNIQVCNGKDENCDGSIDEGCKCTAGEQRFCFLKQVNIAQNGLTNVRGECRAGVQRCVGTAWGKCENATYAVAELCDGKDNDCNGVFDNGFDTDGDRFTTCGTITGVCGLSGPSGCGSLAGDCGANTNAGVGGTLTGLVDCDDGNASRHPCQIDRCGDGNTDDNCDNTFEECQTADGTCASANYAGGYADVGGRLKAECRASGAEFGLVCDNTTGLCQDASECAGKPGQSSTPGTVRPACREPLGCLAGQISAPIFTTNAPANDPYGDCGAIDCDSPTARVFAGASTGSNTGWRVVDPDGVGGLPSQFECHVYPTVAAAQTQCAGGACEGAFAACTREASGGTVRSMIAGAVVNQACQIPLNSNGMVNLGSTCITFANGTVVPPSTGYVGNGVADPLGRCNAGSVGCSGIIASPFGADNTCEYLAAAPTQPINRCNGLGACDNVVDAPACVAAAAAGFEAPVALVAPAACQIAGACATTGVIAPSNLVRNANGGPRGGACGGSGSTCFDAVTAGGRAPNTACGQCSSSFACGANCDSCVSGACRSPWTQPMIGTLTNAGPNAGSGSANVCACGTVTGKTSQIWCAGNCCSSSTFCTNAQSGSCTAIVAPTGISCVGAACDGTQEYCKIDGLVPACTAAVPHAVEDDIGFVQGVAPCNQNVCTGNNICASANFASSTCTTCSGGQFACNGICCSATSSCNPASGGSCNTSTYVDSACGTGTPATVRNCANFGENLDVPSANDRTCGDVSVGYRRRQTPSAANVQCLTQPCGSSGGPRCGTGRACSGASCIDCTEDSACGPLCLACSGSFNACHGLTPAAAACGDCQSNTQCGNSGPAGGVLCTGLSALTGPTGPTGTRCGTASGAAASACADLGCRNCNLDTSCGPLNVNCSLTSTVCQTAAPSPVTGSILATCAQYACAAPTGGLTHLDAGGASLVSCCGRDCIACSGATPTCNNNLTTNDYRDDYCSP